MCSLKLPVGGSEKARRYGEEGGPFDLYLCPFRREGPFPLLTEASCEVGLAAASALSLRDRLSRSLRFQSSNHYSKPLPPYLVCESSHSVRSGSFVGCLITLIDGCLITPIAPNAAAGLTADAGTRHDGSARTNHTQRKKNSACSTNCIELQAIFETFDASNFEFSVLFKAPVSCYLPESAIAKFLQP